MQATSALGDQEVTEQLTFTRRNKRKTLEQGSAVRWARANAAAQVTKACADATAKASKVRDIDNTSLA